MKIFSLEEINPKESTWSADVDKIRSFLGAPQNTDLFPPHFLKSVLPKLGGRILTFENNFQWLGAGFLFPRNYQDDSFEYTLRLQYKEKDFKFNKAALVSEVEKRFPKCKFYTYFPNSEQTFEKTSINFIGFEIGKPNQKEAEEIRNLQQKIWGYNSLQDQDYLYPVDIHSKDFGLGTSLVVRSKEKVIGFLFGFFKFNQSQTSDIIQKKFNSNFRVESQLLGVLPELRGKGLGFFLKKAQAEFALKKGIDIINWTVDPLQYRNAVLNFCELRTVAFNFYQNYYSFRNELNQVSSSRFGISWLIRSNYVKKIIRNNQNPGIVDLNSRPEILIVNNGISDIDLNSSAKKIAIEIPQNWTKLQREDLDMAKKWREITDNIFLKYVGVDNGKYIVTGVGEKNSRKYLIADQVNDELLNYLTDIT